MSSAFQDENRNAQPDEGEVNSMGRQELEAVNQSISVRLNQIADEMKALRLERDAITGQRLQNTERINDLLKEEIAEMEQD